MSGQNIRIMKEARALFLPWCAVVLCGVVNSLVMNMGPDTTLGDAAVFGFCFGIPLLAVMAFGNEFQNRTVSLLFTQPVSRMQIWREKTIVTIAAAVSASLVYYVRWAGLDVGPYYRVFGPAFFLAVVGSAAFWTLVARSTVGGLILNVAVQGLAVGAPLGATWMVFTLRRLPAAALSPVLHAELAGVAVYAAVMLWLGRRKLVRFQVTGEIAGHDLLSARSRVLPESVVQWFRSQPTGVTLNLFKKEMRLLRPIWLLAFGVVACFVASTLLRFLSFQRIETFVFLAAYVAIGMYLLLASVLGGSLSMGEERQLGTHSSNLTSPVSVRRQWFIKLASTMLTSVVCGAMVLSSAYFLLGPDFHKDVHEFARLRDLPGFAGLPLLPLLITLAAFWSACAVNGTIRAAAWTLPVVSIFGAAAAAGTDPLLSEWFRQLTLKIVQYTHPFPGSRTLETIYSLLAFPGSNLSVAIVFAPAIAVILFQSYRFFRREQAEGYRSLLTCLLFLWVVVFSCLFSDQVFIAYVSGIWQQEGSVMREIGLVVDKLPLDPAQLDAAHPQPVTAEDLSKVSRISGVTSAWLAGTKITISPKPSGPYSRLLRTFKNGRFELPTEKLAANLYFSNGSQCRVYGSNFACREPGESGDSLAGKLWWDRLF